MRVALFRKLFPMVVLLFSAVVALELKPYPEEPEEELGRLIASREHVCSHQQTIFVHSCSVFLGRAQTSHT